MAAAGFIKERPDGHADAMGTCYSAGRVSSSSSSSSGATSSSPQGGRTRNLTTPTSGKGPRTQSLSSNSAQKSLSRISSTGKEGSTNVRGASVLYATNLTHTKSPQSSAARLQGVQEEGGSSIAGEAHVLHTSHDASLMTSGMVEPTSEGNGGNTDTHSGDNIPNTATKHTSLSHDGTNIQVPKQIGNGIAATLQTNNPDVGVPPLATMPASAHHAASSRISSPCRIMHRSASSKVAKVETAFMQSSYTEMKTPSLKSGVGAYEVLTPRKLHTMPPRKSDHLLTKASSFNTATSFKSGDLIGASNVTGKVIESTGSKAEYSPLGAKGHGVKGLCKNCKTSNWDSVCFIANDGRIAAANTGPATVCHFHHCNSPKCAANPNYQSPSSLPCKKVLLAKTRASRQQTDKTKEMDESHAADHSDACSSTKSILHEAATEGESHTLPAESGQVFCEENELDATDVYRRISFSKESTIEGAERHGFSGENVQGDSLTSSESSPCFKNDERCALSTREGEKTVPSSSPQFCHGNDDFDYHTDVATTLITKKTAFGDHSNADLAESDATKVSQARKSGMERMRQRYLDCLKEQEAETVRLRKQEMMARKQAGEWMLDSAIGEILHKLAPDGEAGVKVLVEAFETIMQQSDSESHQTDDSVSLDNY